MSETIIRIRDVWKSYAPKKDGTAVHVLEGITLDVYPGEFVCIVGPSGCDKSTLLNIVAGFVRPSRVSFRAGCASASRSPGHWPRIRL